MLLFLESIDNGIQRDSLEELYNLYKEPMEAMAQSILHNHSDAEDVVHDVFLKIATKRIDVLNTLSDNNDAKNYLLVSAKNTAINMLKHNSRRQSLERLAGIIRISDEDFLDMLCQHLEYEELVQMIIAMQSPYREVMYYHFSLEMKASVISHLTNRPLSTVKKQLVRGKKILLIELEKKGFRS